MPIELWLLCIAVIYTYVGYTWGKNSEEKVIEETIDILIENGYLFVKKGDDNSELEIVKIDEVMKDRGDE